MKLAHKHHGKDVFTFAKASSINLFQPPSSWALRASALSFRSCVHSRGTLKKDLLSENGGEIAKTTYPRAAIACGMGFDENMSLTQLCRKKLPVTAIIMGIIAISYGVFKAVPAITTHTVNEKVPLIQNITLREKDLYDFQKNWIEANLNRMLINNEMSCINTNSPDVNSEGIEENVFLHNDQSLTTTTVKDPKVPTIRHRIRPGQFMKKIANSAKAALAKEAEAVIL